MLKTILDKIPNEPSLKEKQATGTRILTGRKAKVRRMILQEFMGVAMSYGCIEIVLPLVELAEIYTDRAGPEVLGQMFTFPDKKADNPRTLCLRPEGTATCQILANSTFRTYPDLFLWYETRCFRYERPQAGRYREFTQFGVEVLNPSRDWTDTLIEMAKRMLQCVLDQSVEPQYEVSQSVKRGLAYYTGGGFEFTAPALGAQKQILGGGPYQGGNGFAIGVDRVEMMQTRYIIGSELGKEEQRERLAELTEKK